MCSVRILIIPSSRSTRAAKCFGDRPPANNRNQQDNNALLFSNSICMHLLLLVRRNPATPHAGQHAHETQAAAYRCFFCRARLKASFCWVTQQCSCSESLMNMKTTLAVNKVVWHTPCVIFVLEHDRSPGSRELSVPRSAITTVKPTYVPQTCPLFTHCPAHCQPSAG